METQSAAQDANDESKGSYFSHLTLVIGLMVGGFVFKIVLDYLGLGA